MIAVSRLNGKKIIINAILIETIEETPDTLITLTNGKKIIVLDKLDDVVSLVQKYMQTIGAVNATIKSLNSEGS